jgi:phosphoribosylamine--glycine ligase
MMKILVIGSGGREHAIIWKLAQSKKSTSIYCAPGNGGIGELATNVDIEARDVQGLLEFAINEGIDLTVVGMDDPLMLGLVDAFEKKGLRIFGPRKNAAILEGSKVFAKDLMKKYQIPTAGYQAFTDIEEARAFLINTNYPTVLKADGLALGKGVLICETLDEALEGLNDIMVEKKFGDAGNTLVVEEFISGPEVSVLSFCDGNTLIPMVSAQDHKRAFDNDEGLNTGGMGTFSPSKYYTDDIHDYCVKNIYQKSLDAMKSEGRPFTGIIFFGLMLTKEGPKVLEYNARFGDPEAQVVLPRLKTDLLDIFEAAIDGQLNQITLEWDEQATVCVVLASGGYPLAYEKGYEIKGLKELEDKENLIVFHAGSKKIDDKIYTNGGRVLGITAFGKDVEEARQLAYKGIKEIDFEKKQYRTDIGIK